MGFSREEMETSIVFDPEENKWYGYSCYPTHMTKVLKILGLENVEAEYEEGRETPISIKFKLNANQVSFRQGKKREMTEEQKEQARLRLQKYRENKDT